MTLWIFFRLHLEDKIFLQDQNVMTYDFMPKFIIIIKGFEKSCWVKNSILAHWWPKPNEPNQFILLNRLTETYSNR
jgi:hypothetical protein